MSLPPACVLGIDVGATKIAAGAVTFPDGQISAHRRILTQPERGGKAVLDDVTRLASEVAEEAKGQGRAITAVGLGLCELVSSTGQILSQSSIAWEEAEVIECLASVGRVTIEADVRAAARAEALFGAGRSHRIFLYCTVGTGIASCLMIDGEPYVGARGATGTMASSTVALPCPHCGEINTRALEQIAAGPALVARLNQLRGEVVTTGQEVLAAARAGDPQAVEAVQSAARALGSSIAHLVETLDPETVVIGGGLGLAEGLYWEILVSSIRQYMWAELHRHLPIVRAETGELAGLIGAAASAWLKQPSG